MKSIKLFSERLLRRIEIIIERKKIKSIRLRVFPNGIVKLSVPFGVLEQWINEYLHKKTPWIEKALDYYKDFAADEVETRIQSGVSTRILGRQIRIMVNESKIYRIQQKEDHIYIQSPVSDDEEALQRQFERWWQKESKTYFSEAIDRLYPIIAKHGFDKPKLHVRKMKTLWGSCSRRHKKVNLNYYLYKAPPPCVDYVVLHELAHFLYPRHDKDFYGFLTIHMPDWKERKRILDHEVVKGIRY
jgi:hypothetical protein